VHPYFEPTVIGGLFPTRLGADPELRAFPLPESQEENDAFPSASRQTMPIPGIGRAMFTASFEKDPEILTKGSRDFFPDVIRRIVVA